MTKTTLFVFLAVVGCTSQNKHTDTQLGELAMQKAMRAVINDSTAYVPLRFNYDTLEVIGDIRSKYRVTHVYSSKYNRDQTAEIEMDLVKYHGSKDKAPVFLIVDFKGL